MSSALTIRRATLEDYDGVMDIGKIYNGRDYLPAKYQDYLEDFNCWVSVIDEVIVGFVADRLVDGGTAIATAAARVKNGYQGRGILAAMLKNIYDSYKDNKAVKYEVMVTNTFNYSDNLNKLTKKYKSVVERHYIEFITDTKEFDTSSVPEPETNVTELTKTDLENIMNSDELRSRLFPNDHLLPSWYPFRAMVENIPLIMNQFQFFGTKDRDGKFNTLTTIDIYPANSFLSLIANICIYGQDTSEAWKHMSKHVQLVSEQLKVKNYKSIMVHVSYSLESQYPEEYVSILKKCGLKPDTAITSTRMIYLRRDL